MDHRDLIYEHYVSGHSRRLSPITLEGLEQRAPYLKRVIERHFPQDREIAILDLGCGHGAFVHYLHRAGYQNVVGVDVSPSQVVEARRLGIEGVQEGNLVETLRGLPDASQDVVIAFDVLEHFTKDELLSFASEVHRVLCPGGKWVIHTPNGEALFGSRSFFWDFTHQTGFTRNSMTQLLKATGFAQVSCYEDKVVVHGFKSAIRFDLGKRSPCVAPHIGSRDW